MNLKNTRMSRKNPPAKVNNDKVQLTLEGEEVESARAYTDFKRN